VELLVGVGGGGELCRGAWLHLGSDCRCSEQRASAVH
jgi:hypothetical protein